MRSRREISNEQQILSLSSEPELEQLVIVMALNAAIEEMKETLDGDFNTIKDEVNELWTHLENAKEESMALEHEISSSFTRLKNMFFEKRPKKHRKALLSDRMGPKPRYAKSRISRLDREVLGMWEDQAPEEEKEGNREVPTTVGHLRKIRRELEDLGKKSKENTEYMLIELTGLKNMAYLQHLSIKSNNKDLDKTFLELQKLIQGCCKVKKTTLSIPEGSKH